MTGLVEKVGEGTAEHYLQRELRELLGGDSLLFEFFVRATTDGLWYWNLEKPDDEWMSPEFWELFGHDPATKRHSPDEWQDLIHPDDGELALRNFEAHLADRTHPYDQIVRYRHADGSTVWVRCRGFALRDDDGVPRRMLGAHTDVTAVKRAEEELRVARHDLEDSNERLQLAIKGVGVGVWDWPDISSPVVHWSPKLYEILGYADGEVPASYDAFVAHMEPAEVERMEKALKAHVEDGEPYDFTTQITTGSGLRKWVRGTGQVGLGDGGVQRIVGGLRDVDDEVRAKRHLQAANDELRAFQARLLQEARHTSVVNEELRAFAYAISHDLKSPMNTLGLLLDALTEELGDDHEAVREFVEPGRQTVDRARLLVDDVLAYTRLIGEEVEPEPVDLDEVIGAVVDDLRAEAADTAIRVEALPMVMANTTHLRVLASNLLSNALKYRRGDVPHEVVVSAAVDPETGLRGFAVRDNGIGIDARHHDQVFEMFQRLHPAGRYPGSGLGLAICKRIVVTHDGRITLDSNPGRGSTFTALFPEETARR